MKLIFHKKLNTKLRGESALRIKLEEIARTEPPGSMFYIEPTQNLITQHVTNAVAAMNDIQRIGYNNISKFIAETNGKSLYVLKIRNEKQPELLAEFQF